MKANQSVTIKLDDPLLERMKDFYGLSLEEDPSSPILGRHQEEGVTVTLYKKNKKGERKALFQGEKALYEARIWDSEAQINSAQEESEKASFPIHITNHFPQIGSDEVGTGDFFGPIIVVASFLKKEDLPFIEEYGITDSKKMSDEKILSLGPSLIKKFDYSELSLPNERFNEEEIRKLNMNEIKAKMHNKALLNLSKRHPEACLYQDQFAEEGLYYSYLKGEKEVQRGIVFSAKGESHFPSVALSSVIGRYAFLRKMAKMGEKYGVVFPLGAGEEVNGFAKAFLDRFGEEEMRKVAKLSFANFRKISPIGR